MAGPAYNFTHDKFPRVKALYSYQYEDEQIYMEEGEIFYLLNSDSKEWYCVCRPYSPESEFYVPSAYVEVLASLRDGYLPQSKEDQSKNTGVIEKRLNKEISISGQVESGSKSSKQNMDDDIDDDYMNVAFHALKNNVGVSSFKGQSSETNANRPTSLDGDADDVEYVNLADYPEKAGLTSDGSTIPSNDSNQTKSDVGDIGHYANLDEIRRHMKLPPQQEALPQLSQGRLVKPLGEDWQQFEENKTKRPFYHNTKTGECKWKPPKGNYHQQKEKKWIPTQDESGRNYLYRFSDEITHTSWQLPKRSKDRPLMKRMLSPTYKTRSEDFKKQFKDIPSEERLIVDYSCALQKEILVHGRMFLTQNCICFYANIFRWETVVTIPIREVIAITKEKTARVIPNAMLVITDRDRYFFTSFTARDKTFMMLFRMWQNVLLDQPLSPQELWHYVHSCYGDDLGLTSSDDEYVPPPSESKDSSASKHLNSGKEMVEGMLNKCKIAIGKKPMFKRWAYNYAKLDGTNIVFYKDKKASVPTKKDLHGKIEQVVWLGNCFVTKDSSDKTSKKNTIVLSKPDGHLLLQAENESSMQEWFIKIHTRIGELGATQDSLDTPTSDKLPKDVQQLDDKAITLFYKALEHGKEKVNNIRLMVVGLFGVGKTSLVNNLIWEFRQKKNNTKTLSTEGIAIHRCKLMTDGDWCLDTELKGVKFGGRIQKVVCNNNQISRNTLSETSANYETSSSHDLLAERVTSTEDHESQSQTEPLQTFKERMTLHKEDEILQHGIKFAKKMLETTSENSEKSKASLDETKNEITVSVWDFAGQTLYYSTHQFFLNERSIYVVVMDMTRSLKDIVSKSDGLGIWCGLVDSCTYLDIFKFWLNAIHMNSDCQSGERAIKPTVILVGTRKDKMKGSAEEKENNMNLYFDNALCSFDKYSPIFNHINKKRFLVNNLSPKDSAFVELRKEIISLAAKQDYWDEEYPVRWIHMEQTLDKMRDEKRQIVKIKDVEKEDLENIHPLGKEELTSFLELQHKQGNIIFFNSGKLKDIVVLAPQWIIEAFKCFIPHNQKIEATVLKDWEEYKKYAILKPNVLDEVMKNSPPYIHEYRSSVINYMEYLNVIAKPLTSEEGITGIPLDFHIVPCLLSRAPPPLHDFTSPPDKPQTPVLAFVFCGKFLPPSFFHRLVAVCIRAWPISQERGRYCLFNGLAIFTLNDIYTLRIWYMDYIIYARIVCCSENEKLDKFIWLFQEVRRKLKKSLKDFVHQSSSVFEECIQCPDMKVSLHNEGLFIVKQFKYKNAIACPVCNPHAVTRSNAMKHWFKERLDRIETDDE